MFLTKYVILNLILKFNIVSNNAKDTKPQFNY